MKLFNWLFKQERTSADIGRNISAKKTKPAEINMRVETISAEIQQKVDDLSRQGFDLTEQLRMAVGTSGNEDLIEYLIRRGANVNSSSSNGETILHLAALLDQAKQVEILLRNGAKIHKKDNLGRTALDVCKVRNAVNAERVIRAFTGDRGDAGNLGGDGKPHKEQLEIKERLEIEEYDSKVNKTICRMETEDLGNGVTLEMVWIPAGTFQMGSPSSEVGRDGDEGPVHAVSLDGFWMGKTQVSQAQYESIMGENPSYFKGMQNPVEKVSWDDAIKFCRKLSEKTGKNYTLPTEAQWEYACRAGSTTRFFFGESDTHFGNYAWYCKNSDRVTHPVGQKKPNAFHLYDMYGNVREWCSDYYGKNYYASSPSKNPTGATSGTGRVLRGGAWGSFLVDCRSACRDGSSPGDSLYYFGLRVVRTQD